MTDEEDPPDAKPDANSREDDETEAEPETVSVAGEELPAAAVPDELLSDSSTTVSPTDVDYSKIPIPPNRQPEDYRTHQRRAEVLQLILRAGSPKAVSQTALGNRYGVAQSTISRDIDTLGQTIGRYLGESMDLVVESAFDRVLSELYDEGEWREAWKTVMEYDEWLARRGAVMRRPDTLKIDADVTQTDRKELDAEYRVLRPSDVDEDTGDVDPEAVGFAALPNTDSDGEKVAYDDEDGVIDVEAGDGE